MVSVQNFSCEETDEVSATFTVSQGKTGLSHKAADRYKHMLICNCRI